MYLLEQEIQNLTIQKILSYISGSTGEIIYPVLVDSPQTFISSVGLYNDNNECVAVAKLSKPLQKDFTKELLLRVKLDF